MPDKAADNHVMPRDASINGAPSRIKRKEGRNVKYVATTAPKIAPGIPNSVTCNAPRKPTKATIFMRGPGVVSPSASPSIIWPGVSQL